MAKITTNPAIRDDGDLAAMLYWELPELANGELLELAEAVRPEMQLRVGERLSSLCGDDELAEFSELVDAGDEESCRNWLDEHVPDHPKIAIVEIERLSAETVAAVEAADDAGGAAVRAKRLRRIEPPSHSLLLRSLDFQGRSYSENGDAAFVEIDTAQGPSFTIRLSLTEGVSSVRAHPIPTPLLNDSVPKSLRSCTNGM